MTSSQRNDRPLRGPILFWGTCVLCVTLVLASGTSVAEPANVSVSGIVRTDVAHVLQDSVDAFNRRDLDAFLQLYASAPDVTYVNGAGVDPGKGPALLVGLAAIRRNYESEFFHAPGAVSGKVPDRLQIDIVRLYPLGEGLILLTGRFTLTSADTGAQTGAGITSLVMSHASGRWRVIYDHSS